MSYLDKNIKYYTTQKFLEDNPGLKLVKEYSKKVAGGSNWVLVVEDENHSSPLLVKHCHSQTGQIEKSLLEALNECHLSPDLVNLKLVNHNPDDFIVMKFLPHLKNRKEFLYTPENNRIIALKLKEMHEAFKSANLDVNRYKTIQEWTEYYINFAERNNLNESRDEAIIFMQESMNADLINKPFQIIHGDFHLNNILFPEDNSNDIRFIDPDGIYSYPEQDIACYVTSSPDPIGIFYEMYETYYGTAPTKTSLAWLRLLLYIMRDFFLRTPGYEEQAVISQTALNNIKK